ncbi:hypothetical protein JTB14_031459 [Gonioctena quinquepunctata]|nr:hypothetical protein JTB14_031459 [Gonioctena quinquepunctata]
MAHSHERKRPLTETELENLLYEAEEDDASLGDSASETEDHCENEDNHEDTNSEAYVRRKKEECPPPFITLILIKFKKKIKKNKVSAEDEFHFESVAGEAGSFVVFSYENELYPGEIVALDDDVVIINAMQKFPKLWKWPSRRDQLEYQ